MRFIVIDSNGSVTDDVGFHEVDRRGRFQGSKELLSIPGCLPLSRCKRGSRNEAIESLLCPRSAEKSRGRRGPADTASRSDASWKVESNRRRAEKALYSKQYRRPDDGQDQRSEKKFIMLQLRLLLCYTKPSSKEARHVKSKRSQPGNKRDLLRRPQLPFSIGHSTRRE